MFNMKLAVCFPCVRIVGLEPTRPFEHMPLKHACLPVPAYPHNAALSRLSPVLFAAGDLVEPAYFTGNV